MDINFGNVAENYAKYRNDLPIELMESLKLRGVNLYDKKVVDLGSGTGVLSRALHDEGTNLIGVEPSAELIKEAKIIDQSKGYMIEYVNTYAESTTLPDDTYDMVTVLRAWHWFDREKALIEINRMLKKNGTLIIIDSGFMSRSKVVMDTLEIIKKYMPNGQLKPPGSKAKSKQMINGFPVEWFKEWQTYQFDLKETYKTNYCVSFTNEEWCGRVGSLSWLSGFSNHERNDILVDIYTHLVEKFGDMKHNIQHACFVTILRRI